MARYLDEDETIDGRSRTSSLILPASQRLSLSNDSMSMMMFFGRMEEMLLKSSLSEGANVLRDGVMPTYMEDYLDLFNNDNIILQAKGSGPSHWSVGADDLSCVTIRRYRAYTTVQVTLPPARSRLRGKGRELETEADNSDAPLEPPSAKGSTKSKRRDRGTVHDRNDLEAMSPPTKASSKSSSSDNIERLLEAQQARIKELTLLAQDAKIRELEMELKNSKSARSITEKFNDRNATSLLSTFKEIIARVRGNIDRSLLCVLDNSPEYVAAEKSHDLIRWWITLQEKTLFSSISKVQFAAGLDSALSTKRSAYFNLALSKVPFAQLATRFIVAYKAFKLADDKITEARMVDYLIDNISGEGIESTRTRIRGAAIFDSEAVMAQSNLSHAIELITKGLFLHNSLQTTANPFAMDQTIPSGDATPPTDKKVGGAAEQQFNQALIMRLEGMSAKLDQVASQVNNGDKGKGNGDKAGGINNNNKNGNKNKRERGKPVYLECNKGSQCKFGDNCRYLHSVAGKPDHRLDKDGVFKTQFLTNLGKKPMSILALSAKLDALANSLSATNASNRAFGYTPTEDDDM